MCNLELVVYMIGSYENYETVLAILVKMLVQVINVGNCCISGAEWYLKKG